MIAHAGATRFAEEEARGKVGRQALGFVHRVWELFYPNDDYDYDDGRTPTGWQWRRRWGDRGEG